MNNGTLAIEDLCREYWTLARVTGIRSVTRSVNTAVLQLFSPYEGGLLSNQDHRVHYTMQLLRAGTSSTSSRPSKKPIKCQQ
jgi:hypothetical protein